MPPVPPVPPEVPELPDVPELPALGNPQAPVTASYIWPVVKEKESEYIE